MVNSKVVEEALGITGNPGMKSVSCMSLVNSD